MKILVNVHSKLLIYLKWTKKIQTKSKIPLIGGFELPEVNIETSPSPTTWKQVMITDVSPRGCVINLGDATPDGVARGFIIMSVHYAPQRHVQIAYLVLTLMERSTVKTNKLFFFEGGLIPQS